MKNGKPLNYLDHWILKTHQKGDVFFCHNMWLPKGFNYSVSDQQAIKLVAVEFLLLIISFQYNFLKMRVNNI